MATQPGVTQRNGPKRCDCPSGRVNRLEGLKLTKRSAGLKLISRLEGARLRIPHPAWYDARHPGTRGVLGKSQAEEGIMRSRYSILVVVALAVLGVAWSVPWTAQANSPSSSPGAGQPVSWYVEWAQGTREVIIVPKVPGSGGVVITDAIVQRVSTDYLLVQRDAEGDQTKVRFMLHNSRTTEHTGPAIHPFGSGIPFREGSSLVLLIPRTAGASMTIIGRT